MKKMIAMLIVNILTTIRIIGVFFLPFIYHFRGGMAAAVLALTCYFTDFIDGILARKCHAATFFGSVYDSLADKLFTGSNLIVFLTITKYAIFPIVCEIVIVLIQLIKYNKNINVQSSKMGKLKTWIISLTVICLYLITDIGNVPFISSAFVSKISALDQASILLWIFIPLYIFEVLTVISYLFFLQDFNPKKEIEVPKIELALRKNDSFKNRIYNFSMIYLNNDFYEKYKAAEGLKKILKKAENGEVVNEIE